jgi:hypothetical protein
MNEAEVEAFLADLDNVQRTENLGYSFFFVGDDHRLPFLTMVSSDNEFDNVSNLDREGVFRINIGIGRKTFEDLFVERHSEPVDYSALNVFLPHPEYSKQHFICILNPAGENVEKTKNLIIEAHSIASERFRRKAGW